MCYRDNWKYGVMFDRAFGDTNIRPTGHHAVERNGRFLIIKGFYVRPGETMPPALSGYYQEQAKRDDTDVLLFWGRPNENKVTMILYNGERINFHQYQGIATIRKIAGEWFDKVERETNPDRFFPGDTVFGMGKYRSKVGTVQDPAYSTLHADGKRHVRVKWTGYGVVRAVEEYLLADDPQDGSLGYPFLQEGDRVRYKNIGHSTDGRVGVVKLASPGKGRIKVLFDDGMIAWWFNSVLFDKIVEPDEPHPQPAPLYAILAVGATVRYIGDKYPKLKGAQGIVTWSDPIEDRLRVRLDFQGDSSSGNYYDADQFELVDVPDLIRD